MNNNVHERSRADVEFQACSFREILIKTAIKFAVHFTTTILQTYRPSIK